MTRGNPRPGQQQMPDRSDEVERQAHQVKAATTQASGEILEAATEGAEAARKARRKQDRAARRAARAPK